MELGFLCLLSGLCPTPETPILLCTDRYLMATLTCLQLFIPSFSVSITDPSIRPLFPLLPDAYCSPGLPPVACSLLSGYQVLPKGLQFFPPDTWSLGSPTPTPTQPMVTLPHPVAIHHPYYPAFLCPESSGLMTYYTLVIFLTK